jgi:hypothetical protein
MECRFSMEAKNFSFSTKADESELRLEERRKGYCGYLLMGFQCSKWLLATVEEALKVPVKKDFVSSYREDAKALMVHGSGNKASRYLQVANYAEGGPKGVIWIPKGRKGWGWPRVVGELRPLLKFVEAKGGSLVSKAPSLKAEQKRGGSCSSCQASKVAGSEGRAFWFGSTSGGGV